MKRIIFTVFALLGFGVLPVAMVLLVEHHLETGDFEKAVAVADVILKHYPNSAYVLAKKGTAYYRLLQRDVTSKYSRWRTFRQICVPVPMSGIGKTPLPLSVPRPWAGGCRMAKRNDNRRILTREI